MTDARTKLAIIVSHPIQYYTPLYQRLAQRDDLAVKVFFTWHAGQTPVADRGFNIPVRWDIDLTGGYEFELVPNLSTDPGTHHFFGLRNPALVERVKAWNPDVVQINGWAWHSHLLAMRTFHRQGIVTLFRGDSHLLDGKTSGPNWWLKRAVLKRVFSWPTGFLVVGKANRAYYQAFDVGPERLHMCPHSIDVNRFAEPHEALESEAASWRQQLGISTDQCVLLFAGKFEPKKRPVELMRAVQASPNKRLLLVVVGSGELDAEVNAIANTDPGRFRVLPFQNQSRMPVVYRLGDIFVLPSAFDETWGLAVNEALACGRPVLVSDAVGCAADVVNASGGRIFSWTGTPSLSRALSELTERRCQDIEMRKSAARQSWSFDISRTESTLMTAINQIRLSIMTTQPSDSMKNF